MNTTYLSSDLAKIFTEKEFNVYNRVKGILHCVIAIKRATKALEANLTDNEKAKHNLKIKVCTWDLEDVYHYSVKQYDESEQDQKELKELFKYFNLKIHKYQKEHKEKVIIK